MNRQQYEDMRLYEDSYWWFIGKRIFVKALISNKSNKVLKILDVGSGTGGMTQYLAQWGEVIGAEKSAIAVNLASSRPVTLVHSDANNLPFINESFDLVTAFDLLYHKDVSSEKVLSEARRVLKSGGRVLIMDCALPILWSRHDEIMHAKKRFRKVEIDALVIGSGFRILRSSHVFFTTLPFLVLSRVFDGFNKEKKGVSIKPLPFFIDKLFICLIFLEGLLLRVFDMPIGSSVIVFAEKE